MPSTIVRALPDGRKHEFDIFRKDRNDIPGAEHSQAGVTNPYRMRKQ